MLTCGLILNLEGVMLIIFLGLPLRPYVVLYPWVDTDKGSEERSRLKLAVPIEINILWV